MDTNQTDYPLVTHLHFKHDVSASEIVKDLALATQVNQDMVHSGRLVKSKLLSFSTSTYRLGDLVATTRNLPMMLGRIQSSGSKVLNKAAALIRIARNVWCLSSSIDERSELELCGNDSAEQVIALVQKNAEFLNSFKRSWPFSSPTMILPKYTLTLDELNEMAEQYSTFSALVSKALGMENVSHVFVSFGPQDSRVRVFEEDSKRKLKARIDFNPSKFDAEQFTEQLQFAKQKIGSR